MRRILLAGAGLIITSMLLLAFVGPADGLVIQGFFSDDNGHLFESDIDAIAEEGITRGCNPPSNDRYCPDLNVERGPMAAFLRRALKLPATSNDYFVDDDNSIFEGDINAIAEAGITRGCNPPSNDRYCVRDEVRRGAMAAFLRRALSLPSVTLRIPLSDHSDFVCDKDGETCRITVDVVAGRNYRIEEGIFQVVPASAEEMEEFSGSNTHFSLTLDGSVAGLSELAITTEDGISIRTWRANLTFAAGSHTLVGRWRWNGDLIQTSVVTVRAGT